MKFIEEFIGMWIRAFKKPDLKKLAENSEKASEMVSIEAEKRLGRAAKGLPFIVVICALVILFTDIYLAGVLALIVGGYILLLKKETKEKTVKKKVTKKKVVKKVVKKTDAKTEDKSDVEGSDKESTEDSDKV